jgi:hypothetical protein
VGSLEGLTALLALLGSFVGSGFALVRFSLTQSRTVVDRFVGFLEGAIQRQEELNARFQCTLEHLGESVRESSVLIKQIAQRMDKQP